MFFFSEIALNHALWVGILAWFLAQTLKIVFEFFRSKRVRLALIMSSGGMPSSHSAMSTAVTTSIGLIEGFGSPLFAVGAIFSMIVMYDASGVRRAAGKHAKAINELISYLENSGIVLEKKLKEMLGHTPLEVLAGGLLGVVLAIIFS